MTVQKSIEANMDSIVGPTHFYAGLAYGNLAAMKHQGVISSPKKAALEGLNKMKTCMDLGVLQLVLPPLERPKISFLHNLGFFGSEEQCLKQAYESNKKLLFAAYSASSMWMANSATMTPLFDSQNQKSYISVANLSTHVHRSIESEDMYYLLQNIFKNSGIEVLNPLHYSFSDEGAANHVRLCYQHHQEGIHLFVYGSNRLDYRSDMFDKYPQRQSLEASQAIARRHCLKKENLIFAKQSKDSVQKGAFHADLLILSHQYVFICHEKTFQDQSDVLQKIRKKFRQLSQIIPIIIEIKDQELSLEEAIASYFFNSQIVSLSNGDWVLLAPSQCQENTRVLRVIQGILAAKNPIKNVIYVPVNQSMFNGGGPACLRLRLVCSLKEWNGIHHGVKFSNTLYHQLCQWVCTYYPDVLTEKQLLCARFLRQCRDALHELSNILGLYPLYSFQKK